MTKGMNVEAIIRLLKLKPLDFEGGYFAETYRSGESIPAHALPKRYRGKRGHGTAIYFLLTPDTFSAIHRLKSDEVFHYYAGDPVEMLLLQSKDKGQRLLLGTDLRKRQRPQIIVPRGVWQGARLVTGGKWALLGTTVAPGFEREDFELGKRNVLIAKYPKYARLIVSLTKW
ncbi:MAG: cupin domain-containing protein [Candidatus Edwardsbacteria bacterium]|nr:cupin domain-containing protein [Candidatus Edwardsbacteria bacterium]